MRGRRKCGAINDDPHNFETVFSFLNCSALLVFLSLLGVLSADFAFPTQARLGYDTRIIKQSCITHNTELPCSNFHVVTLRRTMAPRDNVATSESDVDSGQGGDVALAADAELPWRWIAAALSGHEPTVAPNRGSVPDDTSGTSVWKQKWSGMRLVDTVVLNDTGDVESWVFTAKTGGMTSKKRSQDRAKIAERFERFALANPHNTEGYVAVARTYQDGVKQETRLVLDNTTMREMLIESKVPPQQLLGATLQCFLRPQNGLNSFLRGCYQRRPDQPDQPSSWTLTRVSPFYRSANTVGDTSIQTPVLDGVPDASRLKSETKRVLSSLVAFLETRLPSQGHVRRCEAEFIVDDNGELWLTSLPSVTVTQPEAVTNTDSSTSVTPSTPVPCSPCKKKSPPAEGENDLVGGASQYMPPLGTTTQALAPVDGSGGPLGSARQGSRTSDTISNTSSATSENPTRQLDEEIMKPSSEGALPAISMMLGERSTPGDHNISTVGEKGRRRLEPIIDRKGGVYIANVHASTLRGLCCWREVSVAFLVVSVILPRYDYSFAILASNGHFTSLYLHCMALRICCNSKSGVMHMYSTCAPLFFNLFSHCTLSIHQPTIAPENIPTPPTPTPHCYSVSAGKGATHEVDTRQGGSSLRAATRETSSAEIA